MKYFLPKSPNSISSTIVDQRMIDGGRGLKLAVWTSDQEGKLRTRLRHELIRNREEVNEIPAPNGGFITILPERFANEQRWDGITTKPIRRDSQTILGSDRSKLSKSLNDFIKVTGFENRAEPEIIGKNRFGYTVVDHSFGRTAERRVGRDRSVFPEWAFQNGKRNGDASPDMFYRATNDASLLDNARSIVGRMDRGENLTEKKIQNLADILTTQKYSVSPNSLVEAIEAQVTHSIVSGEFNTRQSIENIMLAFPRVRERKSNTIALQQYSTPFPFGDAASNIFGSIDKKRILDPTVGNGALIASMAASGADVTGIELDYGRMLRASFALGENSEIIHGSFDDQKASLGEFDIVFVNPPFGQLDKKVEIPDRGHKFPTKALHYQIAVEAIQKLKTGGEAFIVLPADIFNPEEATKTADRFANWLRLGFDHVEEAVCDSRLYRGMGADVPVQIFAAKGFRSELKDFSELAAIKESSQAPLLTSFESLYDWSHTVSAKFALDNPQATKPSLEAENLDPTSDTDPTTSPSPSNGIDTPSGRQKPQEGRESSPDAPETIETGSSVPTVAPERPDSDLEDVEDAGIHSGRNIYDDFAPTWLTEGTISDDTQRYQPFSAIGTSNTVIPKSLSGSTYAALSQLENNLGRRKDGSKITIDDYVADALGVTVSELEESQVLSPEQIDAVALLHNAADTQRGALVGDLMGVGKGRTLAALAEIQLKKGGPVLFTTITPSLFTDFVMRDLQDVSQVSSEDRLSNGDIRPHLINSGAVLQDTRSGKTVYKQPANKKDSSGNYIIDPDANLVATSYSQFQTRDGSVRLEAIKEWINHHVQNGHKPLVLLDESHNAASPTSNTGAIFQDLIRYAESAGGSVIRSSATGIKTGEHIELYYSCLPDTGLGKLELLEVMANTADLSLQEALANEMAANGSMIVRQLSSAGVGRELPRLVDFDHEKITGIREKVDLATGFLRDIIEQMPLITEAAAKIAEADLGGEVSSRSSKEKLRLDTNSPVSNLHHFSGYLTLGVKGQFLPDLITDSIARGEKPVIVVEHVGTSVLDWKLAQADAIKVDDNSEYLAEPPHLGDVLKRYVDKALEVKASNALGAGVSINLSDMFSGWRDSLWAKIDDTDFSAFRIDGADLTKAACDALDLSCGEITGRTKNKGKRGVGPSIDGRCHLYEIEGSSDSSVNQETARQFNNGDIDALVINRSASTGISLHASPANGDDCRRRGMIKLEIQADIVQERQIDGRIDRTGQIEPPRYSTPLTGLASDDRLASLFNRKNRSLSASTNATRENDKTIDEVVDLLNEVGQQVVINYLRDNPFLAETLNIDSDSASGGSSVTRMLMGRLICLPLDEQQSVLGEIDVSYRMRLEYLDARGLNPLKNNKYDWKGRIISDEVILHENRVEGIASQPVKLAVVEAPVTVEPLTFDAVMKQAGRGLASRTILTAGTQPIDRLRKAFDNPLSHSYANPDLTSQPFQKAIKRLDKKMFEGGAGLDVSERTKEIQAFFDGDRTAYGNLKDPKKLAFYELLENAEALRAFAKNVNIGGAIGINVDYVPELRDTRIAKELDSWDIETVVVPAIITDYYASSAYPLDPDYWSVTVAVLGESEPKIIPIGNVIRSIREENGDPARWAKSMPFYDFDNWVLTAKTSRADTIINDWLVPDDTRSELFSEFGKAYTERAAEGPMGMNDPLSQREDQKALMRDMFDRTVAGQVMEQKHVMMGNMFRAIVLAQEGSRNKPIGAKIMFSTEDGNWHHGIEIDNGSKKAHVQKIRDKASVAAISSPTIASGEAISALTQLVLSKHTASSHFAEFEHSDRELVDKLYGEIGGKSMSQLVGEHSFEPLAECWQPLSAVFIGPDVLSPALLQPMRKNQKEYTGLNKHAGVHMELSSQRMFPDSLFKHYHTGEDDIKSAVGSVQRDFKKGEMYYFTAGTSSCFVFNPKNTFLQERYPDLVDAATNKQLRINQTEVGIRGGMVAIGVNWNVAGSKSQHHRICDAMAEYGKESDQLPLLTGAFRDLTENFDRFSLARQRELALSQEVSNDITVNAKRDRNQGTPSNTGLSL